MYVSPWQTVFVTNTDLVSWLLHLFSHRAARWPPRWWRGLSCMAWAVTLILSLSRAALTPEAPTAPRAHSGTLSASKGGARGPWEECSTHSSRLVPLVTRPPSSHGDRSVCPYCPPEGGIGKKRACRWFSALFNCHRFVFCFFLIITGTTLPPPPPFLSKKEEWASQNSLIEGQCGQLSLKDVPCHHFVANYIDLSPEVNLAFQHFWCQTVRVWAVNRLPKAKF